MKRVSEFLYTYVNVKKVSEAFFSLADELCTILIKCIVIKKKLIMYNHFYINQKAYNIWEKQKNH
jgi:hypothetical protein